MKSSCYRRVGGR